jgi:hypothetical protein
MMNLQPLVCGLLGLAAGTFLVAVWIRKTTVATNKLSSPSLTTARQLKPPVVEVTTGGEMEGTKFWFQWFACN